MLFLAAGALVVILVNLLGAWGPAWRAAQVPPMVATRSV